MPSPVSGRPAQRACVGWNRGALPVAAVRGELEVIAQCRERGRVDRHGPGLRALAEDPEVRHAPVLVERADREARDLIASEPVVEEDGEDGPVAPWPEVVALRSAEEPAGLGIGERRCAAFVRVLHPGPPDARDGILMDGVGVTEVAEERGDGRELPPPGRRPETARLEHLPPGDDVGPADEPELAEAADPEHRHELPDIAPVRAPGVRVVDVGEPLGRRRRRRPRPRGAARTVSVDVRGPRGAESPCRILLPIMYFINSK